jgi:hypothetical protein
MSRGPSAAGGAALVVFTWLAAGTVAAAPVTLAAVGDPSPMGLLLSSVSDVALDDQGQVAFLGRTAAIFRREPAGIVHVLAAGDTALGRTVAGVGPPDLGAGGCVAFRTVFVGGGSAVLRRCGEVLDAVAESGQAAPGGGTLAGFGAEVATAADGRVAFVAAFGGGGTRIFLGGAGEPVEVVRTGAGSPAGGTFTGFRLVGVSASGRVGFRGAVSGGRDGLFFWDGGGLEPVVVVGDASPAGGSFTDVGFARMNDADLWTFRGAVSGGAASGVFRADAAPVLPVLSAAVLVGAPTPIGGTFRAFPDSLVPSIDPAGRVAFRATVADAEPPSGAFVVEGDGTLSKVVAVGETTDSGVLVRLRDVELADDGSVLVRATVAGGSPGIFHARDGRVEPLAVLGDATDLGGGFRFTEATVQATVADAIFLGERAGVFLVPAPGEVHALAELGAATPLGGTYTTLDPPTSGERGPIVFGAGIAGGRAGEAIFAVRGRRVVPLVSTRTRARPGRRVLDFFLAPLDDLTRPGVGPGALAFQAAIGGRTSATGVFAQRGRRLRTVALEGARAPGGRRYVAFGTPAVVGRAQVAFVAQVEGGEQALLLGKGRRTRLVAATDDPTRTRLGQRFLAFDTPATGDGGVAVRATLAEPGREGVFFIRGRTIVALAATGEAAPGGGRFRRFATNTVAGRAVVFGASTLGGPPAGGLYAVPVAELTEPLPTPTALALEGQPSPAGGAFLSFGPPSGNRHGAVAVAAELTGAATTSAVLLFDPIGASQ